MIGTASDWQAGLARERRAADDPGGTSLVSTSMREFALTAAGNVLPVLLQGETGVGKSHLARLIHQLGPRRERPFLAVNCGAIPHELFEREMFGHVRGAFTGAVDSRPGLFEAAHGGTLFLDEIGELPLLLQPKLLRVLEEGAVRRVGSTQQASVDVRIITATNRNLCDLVEEKLFREDLFYRCCVLEYRISPLRERREEIPALVRCLLRAGAKGSVRPPEVSAEALERICGYAWPGNLRELSNVLSQAIVYSRGGTIELHHLPERVREPRRAEPPAENGGRPRGAPRSRGRYTAPPDAARERELIVSTLREEGENRTRAAERLGMCRATLWMKLKQYGIA